MPKFLGLDKKKWLYVGLAAAAVGVYFLLSRGSGAGAAAGPAEQPIAGGNTGGYMPGQTPPGGFFDSGEQAASYYSNQLQQGAQQLQGAFFNNGLYQAVPGGFVNTGVKNPSAKGTFIPSDLAVSLGSQNKGPLAHGESFLQKFSDVLNVGASAYGSYTGARAAMPSGGGTRSAASYGFPGVTGSNETAAHAYETASLSPRAMGRRRVR